MKPKKKPSVSNKKNTKKPLSAKPLLLIDKTIVTTKEKTHNTIQDPVQIKDHRTHIITPRNHPNRFACVEKLQQCNLSPFSSPGGSSISPRCKKASSPIVKEEKQKKRLKQKLPLQSEKTLQKKKISQQKRQSKEKAKTAKEECNKTYQNFVLKRLDQKKITEMSEESQVSIGKVNKLHMNFQTTKQKAVKTVNKSSKVRELKQSILNKYRKELASFNPVQLNFFCSVVLIQRLWKQKYIKNFINKIITPRSNPQCNSTIEIPRQSNLSKMETAGTSQEQTFELIKKYHHQSSIFQKKQSLTEREIHSTQMQTAKKDIQKFNLQDLQLSAELSPQKQKKMINFVECIRDIKFSKAVQSKKKYKMNVFNLESSLSEKCLMQSFYEKVFKNSPTKMNNFDVFNSKKEQKQLQRSIQLINSIKSPQKAELVDIQQRFQTELQSEEQPIEQKNEAVTVKIVQKAQACVDTQGIQLRQPASKQITSLKDLNLLSQQIIFLVLAEFCQEFHSFTSKSTLRKKKKNTLPGLKVTLNTIREYLNGLTTYMMQEYESDVVRRFNLISPLSFLKIHHQYDDEDEYIDQEDEEINMPILPNTLFYQYQLMYEEEKFKIKQEDKKFSNFLQSLIKIHNLLLSNCLSQILQKTRIDRVVLPWDSKFDANRHKRDKISKKNFENQLNKITNSICDNAFMRVGQFHKRLDDTVEEQKLLKSISLQYKSEGNEWSAQYQYLELRMDLTKYVQEVILEQLTQDLMIFF